MRKRTEIEKDPKAFDALTLEILLDIRELLSKQSGKPRGRPKKIK